MKSILHLVACSTVWIALAGAAHAAGADRAPGAAHAPAADPGVPTSIELALAELSCGPRVTDAARFDCLSATVASLRADFGYDLSRLAASQRNAIDKGCGDRLTTNGHQAYIACINSELTSLRAKNPPPAPPTPSSAAAAGQAAATAGSPPRTASSNWIIWLAAVIGLGSVVGGAIVLVTMRSKGGASHCRSCGGLISATAELCADCRKQVADARRLAAAERDQRHRTLVQGQDEPAHVTPHTRVGDEAAPTATYDHHEQTRPPGPIEDTRLPEEESVRREPEPLLPLASASEPVFDPYATLGVAADAPPDVIRAAYQQARARYAAEAVEFLGDEVQMYYRAKANAVDRAYQMLTGEVVSSTQSVAV